LQKSKNILIDTDGSTKLADFGVSRELNQSGMARSMVGTPLFMAPEVLEGESYSMGADVWSLGIVALHIANGEIPRRGTAVRELMRIVIAEPAPRVAKPERWSPAYASFVARCLVKDPSRRATCEELINHPWVTGCEDNGEQTKTDLRRRTIGRTSLYSPRKAQRATVPPRAGAATMTPSRAAAAAAVPGPNDATPPAKQHHVAAAATPVAQAAVPVPAAAGAGQDELIKELLGWKQLALKLLDEREKGK
jgi:serine/threonine protein kinase